MSEHGFLRPNPALLSDLDRSKRRPKLAHELGEGARCNKCGDACEGFQLHYWRWVSCCSVKYRVTQWVSALVGLTQVLAFVLLLSRCLPDCHMWKSDRATGNMENTQIKVNPTKSRVTVSSCISKDLI